VSARAEPRLRAHGEQSNDEDDEGAPLLSSSGRRSSGYGSNEGGRKRAENRRGSSSSSRKRSVLYNVNYPPSIPGSPALGPSSSHADLNFGDEMIREQLAAGDESRSNSMTQVEAEMHESPFMERRHTIALQAEEDVCFPQEGMSVLDEEELHPSQDARGPRRRRWRNKWPDLAVLEDWSRLEKESRSEGRRMKKITEPQLINGRLRPVYKGWYRTEEDAPYRFTYFNEEFESTIHSQSISELVQPDASFRELFIPDAPLLSESSDDDEPEQPRRSPPLMQDSRIPTRQPSFANTGATAERIGRRTTEGTLSPKQHSGVGSSGQSRQPSTDATRSAKSPPPLETKPAPLKAPKPPQYGDRPVWWLDVLSPTEAEMKVLQKAFGIHPLTTEDIMLQEQREKVELFRHYYFVNYRSFDQDAESDTHLDPINMYVVVFREGVISFHFNQTPHPANVRRRIRQLKDFMVLSADWISYAIIDDITDVFVPLIQGIEEEVDEIDDAIMRLHRSSDPAAKNDHDNEKKSIANETVVESDNGDMLHRVGDCRKKVMSLYRLLGNKADVIKGFAKRCNEHWEVAPRSEIGLYLGDIQDHIVTMTGSLSHYEM
jgi:magnesium transporter